ncbi:MAG: hypothetical protein V4654_00055 [Bdellovibrionota bacterium]
MYFLRCLVLATTISTAAQALTLDSGKFTGTLTEDVVVLADCDLDGYHCNHVLKNLSKTSVSESTSVKDSKITVLELNSISRTQWVAGASLFDIVGAKLEIDLSHLPQEIKFGAMAGGVLTVTTINGENSGIDSKKFEVSCTVNSSRLLTCKAFINNKTNNQLNLRLKIN